MEAVERGIGGTDFVGIHQRLGVICSSLQKSSQYHEQVMASLNDLSRGNFSVPPPVNHTDQLRDIRKKVSEINLSDLTLRVSDLSSQVQKIPTQIMDFVIPKLGEVSTSAQDCVICKSVLHSSRECPAWKALPAICWKCGSQGHRGANCPYRDTTCSHCNRRGHLRERHAEQSSAMRLKLKDLGIL